MATPTFQANIAGFFCCTGGKLPGPHIFILPGGINVPSDIMPYVAYGQVDSSGNWRDPNGVIEGTGCQPLVTVTSWIQARQLISQCSTNPPVPPVPPIQPPVPPIVPPQPGPPQPGPPTQPPDTTPPSGSCDNPTYVVLCPPVTDQPAPAQPPQPDEIPSGQIECGQPPVQRDVRGKEAIPAVELTAIDKLCCNVDNAIQFLSETGAVLRDLAGDGQTHLSTSLKVMQRLASDTTTVPFNIPSGYWDYLAPWLGSTDLTGIASQAAAYESSVFSYDLTTARNIYALLKYMESLRDTTVDISLSAGDTRDSGYSMSTSIWGFGTKSGGKLDAGLHAANHIALKVIVLPTIALCEYVLAYVTMQVLPSVGEAVTAYLKGELTDVQRDCIIRLHGINPQLYAPIIASQRERLSPEQIIEYGRRLELKEQDIRDAIASLGYTDPSDVSAIMSLYDELPTPADFLHYLQRNVYDTQYVQDYGLLEGFDERYWANFGADLSAIGVTYERSKLDYAAHWIRPAPGELREFVYRNNPDYYAGPNPTTVDDYRRTLAEQDYSPWDVKRYVDTIYRVPALGYLRDMYRSYLLSDEQMKTYHQKLGYSGEDSDHFVEIDKLVRARIRASEAHGWTPAALAAAFSVGVLSDTDVIDQMNRQGYSSDEANTLMERARAELQRTITVRARSRVQFAVLTQVKQALTSGIVDESGAVAAITQLGWPSQFAEGWVQVQTSALRVKLVNQTVARIRSAFLSGEIDAAFAASSLTRLGVVQAYIEQTLVAWELQLTPQRKRRSAAQIVSDLSYGMLDTSEALVRLTNLGYEEPDRLLYLADAQRKIVQREAKEAAAQQKTARQQANDLRRLEADARSQADRLRGVLQRVASRPTLMAWAKHGIISFDEFYKSMKDLNYDDDNIQRYWLDACSAKTAKCIPATPPIESPPASPGGSVYTPDELGGIMP